MGQDRAQKFVRAALSIFFAFIVYEAGKLAALLVMQVLGDAMSNGLWLEGLGAPGQTGGQQSLWNGLGSLLMQIASGGICCILWGRQIHWKKKEGAGKGGPARGALFLISAASAALGLNLLLSLTGAAALSEDFQRVAAAQAAVPIWLGAILYGLAAPFSEEVMFRGIVYGKMKELIGAGGAMILSSLLFGIYHGNVVQAVYGALLGVVLSYLYERTDSLLASVLFHGTGNLAVYLLIDVWGLGTLPGHWGWEAILCVILLGTAAGCLFGCLSKKSQ